MKRYKTIVVGLGAAGSAALYHVSGAGPVLGIDKYHPPHSYGSSHGFSRITRQAIGEGSHYTPLALRSYELLRQLERKVDRQFLQISGGLFLSAPQGQASKLHVDGFFENTLAAAVEYGIKHDVLDAPAIRRRFPQFNVQEGDRAYYEYEAGILAPEAIIETHLDLARLVGAVIQTGETFLSYEESKSSVIVHTDKDSYEAENLVLTVGPWLPQILKPLAGQLKVMRQVMFWFDVDDYSAFQYPAFPVFIWQIKGPSAGIYGFPAIDGAGGGFKIGSEAELTETTADSLERQVSQEEIERVFNAGVKPFFPGALPKCVRASACMYTVTPDSGFIIDWMPDNSRVLVCSPCSGHGFKHSPAVGEIVGDLINHGSSSFNLEPYKLGRLLGR